MIGDPPVVRTPEERFALLPQLGYPWTPKYLHMKREGNQFVRVHYIDEGPRDASETLLLLHGTPAWSYLYRKTIPTLLAAGYRVVAIDHIGFGRSDKLTDPEAYTHELHVATVVNAVRDLDLQGVTLVGHDIGGPTGLSALSRDSGRYRRVILLNTWLPQGDMFSSLSSIKEHLPYLSFRGLTQVLGRNLPVETVFSMATQASAAELQGYVAPYPFVAVHGGSLPMAALDPDVLLRPHGRREPEGRRVPRGVGRACPRGLQRQGGLHSPRSGPLPPPPAQSLHRHGQRRRALLAGGSGTCRGASDRAVHPRTVLMRE
ncbi:haloalkane dehalogenase-like [Penaeus chinensis]|uniref:haloalkane dehalogenase-like n=1 Tax=Penaeus chinensis TaxID=139456 RepID=UPI001FB7F4AD|nr:haloalkane dehalogenase-like [Penaeus chinensis]XP_047496914.1 haloalkane dehalogenase-like [Penaeus chinensis]